jgi:LCP family protein required for cell wall assembly
MSNLDNFPTKEVSSPEENSFKLQIRSKNSLAFSRIKRRILKHVWLVRIGLVLGILGAIAVIILAISLIVNKSRILYYLDLATSFIFAPNSKVTAIDDRVNILVLGKSGQGTSSPDLTDTIIFASLDLQKSKISLVSLPRDIWVPAIRAKINSAYYWGNKPANSQPVPGGGLKLAKSLTEEIVGQPIEYAVVLDFSGFEEMINAVGGIDVNVERPFTDNKFPIPGKENDLCNGDKEYKCRYETITFEKGLMHMDGALALKFARSRNAEGDEGTDLARAARQEKIIQALKEKILSKQVLLSLTKLIRLYKAVMKNLETDIPPSTQAVLARKLFNSRKNIKSSVLPADLLTSPKISARYDYQYVFLPKSGDWKEVQNWIQDLIK